MINCGEQCQTFTYKLFLMHSVCPVGINREIMTEVSLSTLNIMHFDSGELSLGTKSKEEEKEKERK